MNEEDNELPPQDPGTSSSTLMSLNDKVRRINAQMIANSKAGYDPIAQSIKSTTYISTSAVSDMKIYEEAILSIYKIIFLKDATDAKIAIIEITDYLKKKGADPAIKELAIKQALKELKEMSENI